MKKVWYDKAWEDYLSYQNEDKRLMKKLNNIIKEIERIPYTGIGNPEPLNGNLSGLYSRRIDEKNRIIYRVVDGVLEIVSCKGHYDDK